MYGCKVGQTPHMAQVVEHRNQSTKVRCVARVRRSGRWGDETSSYGRENKVWSYSIVDEYEWLGKSWKWGS